MDHHPDDTVAVRKNNVWLDSIGDFSLREPLNCDALNIFVEKLAESKKETATEKSVKS